MENIFSQTSNELIQQSINEVSEQIQKDLQPSEEKVKTAARELIKYTQEIENEYRNIVNQKNAFNSNTDIETVFHFTKKMIKNKEQFTELMRLVYNFQNEANALLNQRVQMTFLYFTRQNKVEMYTLNNSVEDLTLDRAAQSRGGSITGRYKKTLIASKGKLIEQKPAESTHLDSTFEEVYTRFKISKQKQKLLGAAYILWKENGELDGAYVSGAGPLGEAYFNFFINEYEFNSMIEPAVKDFMINEEFGAIMADSTSGFLQGDVSKNGIEYGIKIQSATALGYTDIIKYAQEVLEQTNIKQYLINLKQKLQLEGSKNMVRLLNKNLNEISDELKQAIQQRIET